MYAGDSSRRNIHNDSRRVIESVATLTEKCWSQKFVQDLFLASIKKVPSTDKAGSEKMKIAGKIIYMPLLQHQSTWLQ